MHTVLGILVSLSSVSVVILGLTEGSLGAFPSTFPNSGHRWGSGRSSRPQGPPWRPDGRESDAAGAAAGQSPRQRSRQEGRKLSNSQKSLRNEEDEVKPDATRQAEICRQRRASKKGRVRLCDVRGVIDFKQADSLEAYLASFCIDLDGPCARNYSSCRGYALYVTIIDARDSFQNPNVSGVSAGDLHSVADGSLLQSSHCDSAVVSVLLLLADTPRVDIRTGEGAARHLTAYCLQSVTDSVYSNLTRGSYGDSVTAIIHRYRRVLAGEDKTCRLVYPTVYTTGIKIWIIYAAVCTPIMLCVTLVFLGPWFKGRGFGGKKHRTEYTFTYAKRFYGYLMTPSTDE